MEQGWRGGGGGLISWSQQEKSTTENKSVHDNM